MAKQKESVTTLSFETKITEIKIESTGIKQLLVNKRDKRVAEKYDAKISGQVYEKDNRSERDAEKINEKIHYTENGKIGFPSSGFLMGMARVASDRAEIVDITKKRTMSSITFLDKVIPLKFDKQTIQEDIVDIQGVPRLCCRPRFDNWSCKIRIEYSPNIISLEELVNLLNTAGFYSGLGSWSKRSGGVYGTYKVG